MATRTSLDLRGASHVGFEEVLTADALEFVAELHRRFNPRRLELLESRRERRERLVLFNHRRPGRK